MATAKACPAYAGEPYKTPTEDRKARTDYPQDELGLGAYYSEQFMVDENLDNADLMSLNNALFRARKAMAICFNQINEAARKYSEAVSEYEQVNSRATLLATGGTVSDREALVALETFEESEKVRLWKVTVDKLKRQSKLIQDDISLLTTATANVRAQAKI